MVECDAVGNKGVMLNYAVAEHVENAGVPSGDAMLILPVQKPFVGTHQRVKNVAEKVSDHDRSAGGRCCCCCATADPATWCRWW